MKKYAQYKSVFYLLTCVILAVLLSSAFLYFNLARERDGWKKHLTNKNHELILQKAEQIKTSYNYRLLRRLKWSFINNDLAAFAFIEAEAAHNLRDSQHVEKCFNEAIKFLQDPRKAVSAALAHYNLGINYTDQMDLGKGLEAFTKSIRLDPSNPKAKLMLEMYLIAQRRMEMMAGSNDKKGLGLDSRDTRRALPWSKKDKKMKESEEREELR